MLLCTFSTGACVLLKIVISRPKLYALTSVELQSAMSLWRHHSNYCQNAVVCWVPWSVMHFVIVSSSVVKVTLSESVPHFETNGITFAKLRTLFSHNLHNSFIINSCIIVCNKVAVNFFTGPVFESHWCTVAVLICVWLFWFYIMIYSHYVVNYVSLVLVAACFVWHMFCLDAVIVECT